MPKEVNVFGDDVARKLRESAEQIEEQRRLQQEEAERELTIKRAWQSVIHSLKIMAPSRDAFSELRSSLEINKQLDIFQEIRDVAADRYSKKHVPHQETERRRLELSFCELVIRADSADFDWDASSKMAIQVIPPLPIFAWSLAETAVNVREYLAIRVDEGKPRPEPNDIMTATDLAVLDCLDEVRPKLAVDIRVEIESSPNLYPASNTSEREINKSLRKLGRQGKAEYHGKNNGWTSAART